MQNLYDINSIMLSTWHHKQDEVSEVSVDYAALKEIDTCADVLFKKEKLGIFSDISEGDLKGLELKLRFLPQRSLVNSAGILLVLLSGGYVVKLAAKKSGGVIMRGRPGCIVGQSEALNAHYGFDATMDPDLHNRLLNDRAEYAEVITTTNSYFLEISSAASFLTTHPQLILNLAAITNLQMLLTWSGNSVIDKNQRAISAVILWVSRYGVIQTEKDPSWYSCVEPLSLNQLGWEIGVDRNGLRDYLMKKEDFYEYFYVEKIQTEVPAKINKKRAMEQTQKAKAQVQQYRLLVSQAFLDEQNLFHRVLT